MGFGVRVSAGDARKDWMATNIVNKHESDGVVERIVGAAYEVGNVGRAGFLEKVYERALAQECGSRGLRVRTQVRYRILYKGRLVGDYFADLLVEERVVVELKCAEEFSRVHIAQCINYLKASGLRSPLLVNFQRSKVEWRLVVHG
jgi:GxxExxY protein